MQKDENIAFKTEFLKTCYPLYIVNLGNGVFKGVGVSCVIMVYKKESTNKDTSDNNTPTQKTLLFDFQNIKNRYYKFVPHVGL